MSKKNFSLSVGETFDVNITWTDSDGNAIDLTGYTGNMQVRSASGSELILELTSDNDRIVIATPVNGIINLLVAAEDTLELEPGNYKYDLLMTTDEPKVVRLLDGNFSIDSSITVIPVAP